MLDKGKISEIGSRIKRMRERKKMTQSELGQKVHMDKSKISKIETNTQVPALEELIDIADALDVRAEYLLGIDSAIDKKAEFVKSFVHSFTKITTTREYTANAKDSPLYDGDDAIFYIDDDYLVLIGHDSIFSLIKDIADAENLKKKISDKAYVQMISNAKQKFGNGKEREESKYFLISGEQMTKIIEQAVIHQKYGETLLQEMGITIPLDGQPLPPQLKLNIDTKDESK